MFPLAVNFLDRFLCACAISRRQLQLTAAVCLLLASKIRQCHALSVDLLCFYSDHSIAQDELRVSTLNNLNFEKTFLEMLHISLSKTKNCGMNTTIILRRAYL